MPIIEFSDEDILSGVIVVPAWYHVKVNAIGEKDSKKGDSINYPVDAIILYNADNGEEEFKGVPLNERNWQFNSKIPAFIIDFIKAVSGAEVKAKKRVELNDAVGQELDVFIGNSTYEGRVKNNVTHQYRVTRDVG